jgi:hypothetical protein
MSQYVVGEASKPIDESVSKSRWTIRDTEFLLRLIMSSKIDGADIETASSVIKKVKNIHKRIVENEVSV